MDVKVLTPVSQEILDKIAQLGEFDAVYDDTAESVPMQKDTVVIGAVKVRGGFAFSAIKRFSSIWLEGSGIEEIAARLEIETWKAIASARERGVIA